MAIEEYGAGFGFSSRRHDRSDCGAFGVDGTVGCWIGVGRSRRWRIAEIEVPSCTAASFGLYEIRGVAIDVEAHVAGMVANCGVGVCVSIVHEHLGLRYGVSGRCCLL